jgi:membrane-associated phospholipid phosphatase
MRRRTQLLLAAAGLCLGTSAVRTVKAAELSSTRSARYYGLHLGVITAELAAMGAVQWISGDHARPLDLPPAPSDDPERGNFSNAAAVASDHLRLLTLALPVAAQLSDGFSVAFGNAALVFTEVQSTNLLLTTLTKEIVRRPRPYTHSHDPEVLRFARSQGSEAFISFYSGHASASYAGAMAGSLLYAARTAEPWARHFMWGTEFLLAGITAQLRVRSGRHYRSDVWVGSLLGSAIGVALPALHGIPLSRVRPTEVAVAAGAALLTNVGGELVDPCAVLNLIGACEEPKETPRASLSSASDELQSSAPAAIQEVVQWTVLPIVSPGGLGVQAHGYW